MGGDIQNTDLQHDSNKVKGCSKRGRPCTACLDGLNRDILQHNEGIWWNTYHCFIDVILDLTWRDSWFWQAYRPLACAYPLCTAPGMHHAMKLWYGIDNPGEVGSTAVYLPSWIPSTLYVRLLAQEQPYNNYTNMLPLEYQVTPALQLSALNFELSWKIVTWKDRHTDGHWLCLRVCPPRHSYLHVLCNNYCIGSSLVDETMVLIVIAAWIHRWRKVHVDWSIYMSFVYVEGNSLFALHPKVIIIIHIFS